MKMKPSIFAAPWMPCTGDSLQCRHRRRNHHQHHRQNRKFGIHEVRAMRFAGKMCAIFQSSFQVNVTSRNGTKPDRKSITTAKERITIASTKEGCSGRA
jgi:hypothetical protein